ncbi:uncharacterized protein LOC107221411 [Neodiprion lecontei]|uniref:Uncharacterized protein LOC107221411 n=1 Tax=Neodiprion lecontei TaxID=441921 RepID=A0A6J0BMR9_NEOLC|nr:uncharacterized protein LOC107221411 [Neodiprion lecontei]
MELYRLHSVRSHFGPSKMTRGEWVLLPGLLGLLFSSLGVAATPTNGAYASGVCAFLCDSGLGGEPCEAFCTSRRQSASQSNTVTGKRDVADLGLDAAAPATRSQTVCDFRCDLEPRPTGCSGCPGSGISGGKISLPVESHRPVATSPGARGVPGTSDVIGERDAGKNDAAAVAGDDFDREKFCKEECRRGNGGLACNCDIIP